MGSYASSLARTSASKSVSIIRCTLDGEKETWRVTFENETDFKDFLTRASAVGFIDASAQGKEIILINHGDDVEDGKTYRVASFWGDGASWDTEDEVDEEDASSVIEPSLQILRDSNGRDDARFKGKGVVQAFVAGFAGSTASQSMPSVRRACAEQKVKLYRRHGRSLCPSAACMRPVKRVAAAPMATLRMVM
ncbi:hypothetical protein HYH03_018429 [Edaphochlamys debaryana]|uniref:Uncharacterized protein n=1 Tax=Edaphochlamys debaryana TaxID=47281 RepID=A0A835XFA9_9CHLO|nr:hypothetical protein HYH03_018429 [Edaphochlamys debaryana]|eukprot:KAG2482656.1 hypothetical protein HYH03_018429 [Edaphochlamys debaryana]